MKELQEVLEDSAFQEIIWHIEIPDGETFPVIYGYQKLYSGDYTRCIGYMEVQLSSQLFADYFELLSSLSDDRESVLTLYYGDELIYSASGEKGGGISSKEEGLVSQEEKASFSAENRESGYEIRLWENQYRNYLAISKLNLCVVRYGYLMNENILPSDNIPSIIISCIILLLIALFLLFFMQVVSLSRRILAFSTFIKCANPDHLLPFHPEKERPGREDELDSLIAAYNLLIQENNSLISQIEKVELFASEAKYQALQGQIHPHFIYGTLETIRILAMQNQGEEAVSMIFSLSALIRYSVSISAKSVTLQEEVEIARHYLQIQKIRFGERIDYTFQVEEGLLALALPRFILQPILENAIIYGVTPTLDDCTLMVEAYEEETNVIIRVSNTGLLITPRRLAEVNDLLSGKLSPKDFAGNRNGMALNNIRERIGIFFDGKARIQLERQDNCTAAIITISKK